MPFSSDRPARTALSAGAATAVYALVTALLFHKLLPDLGTHLYSDIGDPLLNVSILAWNAQHVPLSAAWWNFPSFAPLSGVTAFTEHLLWAYPIATPVIWLTGNAVLAHNVVMLALFPLNGWAMYLLARAITGSSPAAFIGGLAFAFAPHHSVHLSHIQVIALFGMPLGMLGLHRALASGAGRSALPALALFGVGWFVTALSNAYMLVFFPVLVALWCAWFVRPREWRRLVAPVGTAILFTVPLVPLLRGYRVRQAAYGLLREIDEIRSFSADLVGLLGVSHREWLWHGILPHTYEEGALFPGLTIVGLAVVAVVAQLRPGSGEGSVWSRWLFRLAAALTLVVVARALMGPFGWRIGPIPLPPFAPFRLFTVAAVAGLGALLWAPRFRDAWSRRDPLVGWAWAAAILWLLAIGPQPEWSGSWRALLSGPYALLMGLPGVSSIRVPARAWLPATLCLSVLAAAGTAVAWRRVTSVGRRGAGTLLVAALGVALLAEGWFVDRHVPAPAAMSVGTMPAGTIPAGALVLDLPIEEGFWNATPQYRAVLGGYRTLNGYSGYQPPHFLPMRRAIADLHRDALTPFQTLADLYVIVRPETVAPVARWVAEHPGAVRVHQSREAVVFRLPRLNPDAPRRALPLPLPRPGAKPFAAD